MDNNAIFAILNEVLSQAFGTLALICTVVSMQLKKKLPLMILQTMSEAFIVVQYLIKGAFTGALMSITSFVRDIIFTKYGKRRAPLWILLVIYAFMTYFTYISWNGPLSLLPYGGSLIFAWSLWYGKVSIIRLGNFFGNTPYIIYTAITGNYVLCAMTIFEVASSLIGYLRHDLKKKKKGSSSKKRTNKTTRRK